VLEGISVELLLAGEGPVISGSDHYHVVIPGVGNTHQRYTARGRYASGSIGIGEDGYDVTYGAIYTQSSQEHSRWRE